MNIYLTYAIIAVLLVAVELVYFKFADHFNIIDKPNERSSHSKIVLRGGGVIFSISVIIWAIWQMITGFKFQGPNGLSYGLFIVGLLMEAVVSFWDDVHSLPDSVRLVVQFVATALMLYPLMAGCEALAGLPWYVLVLIGIVALVVFVGATDVINFMDGINGITAGYSLAVLIPLMLVSSNAAASGETLHSALRHAQVGFQGDGPGLCSGMSDWFIEPSLLVVVTLAVLVFAFFNFRPRGKAKCFAGDVGSIGMAFILLYAIGRLMAVTGDVTWLIFLVVYGVDGVMTILHRIMLHENLGEAHRKHAYQLMANELGMSHVVVSLIYMGLQLAVSLGFIFLCPNTVAAHWIYLVAVIAVLVAAYVLFMKKYYHLHEEYLASLKK